MPDVCLERWGDRGQLRRLAGQPFLVDVLDALTAGPLTVAEMRATIPRARRILGTALRDLVVTGLVTVGAPGSRDDLGSPGERYRHTAQGRAVVALLSSFSVWTALYDD